MVLVLKWIGGKWPSADFAKDGTKELGPGKTLWDSR
jgi:hypothetical protein